MPRWTTITPLHHTEMHQTCEGIPCLQSLSISYALTLHPLLQHQEQQCNIAVHALEISEEAALSSAAPAEAGDIQGHSVAIAPAGFVAVVTEPGVAPAAVPAEAPVVKAAPVACPGTPPAVALALAAPAPE